MEPGQSRKEYFTVDVAKLIGAFIVVFGHSYLADADGMMWYDGLVDASVQMFFIFSGYFVAERILHDAERMKNYVRHLLYLLLFWSAIYFFWDVLWTDRTADGWMTNYISRSVYSFCSLDSGHLWYIQNLLAAIVILYTLRKVEFTGREVVILLAVAALTNGLLFRAIAGVAFGLYLHSGLERSEKGMSIFRICGGGRIIVFDTCLLYEGSDGK